MDNRFLTLLESRTAQGVALLITVVAGVVQVIETALPGAVRPIALVVLILFAAYLGGAVVTTLIRRRSRNLTPPLSPAQVAYDYDADRYGIGYESLDIECLVGVDGGAQVERKVTVAAHSRIETLDTYLVVPERSASGTPFAIDTLKLEALSGDRELTFAPLRDQSGKVTVGINFSPPLLAGETTAYGLRQVVAPGTYAVNLPAAELAQRELPDYFAWNINRPTRRLVIRIYFPEAAKPTIYGARAQYASASGLPSRTDHHKEQLGGHLKTRMRGPFGGQYVLELTVDQPMVGLIYMLQWTPSPRPA